MTFSRIKSQRKSSNEHLLDHKVGAGNSLSASMQISTLGKIPNRVGVMIKEPGLTGTLKEISHHNRISYPLMGFSDTASFAISHDMKAVTFDNGANFYRAQGDNVLEFAMNYTGRPAFVVELDTTTYDYPVFYKINVSTHDRFGFMCTCPNLDASLGCKFWYQGGNIHIMTPRGERGYIDDATAEQSSGSLPVSNADTTPYSLAPLGRAIGTVVNSSSNTPAPAIVVQDEKTFTISTLYWSTLDDSAESVSTDGGTFTEMFTGFTYARNNSLVLWGKNSFTYQNAGGSSPTDQWTAPITLSSLGITGEMLGVTYNVGSPTHFAIRTTTGLWRNHSTIITSGTYKLEEEPEQIGKSAIAYSTTGAGLAGVTIIEPSSGYPGLTGYRDLDTGEIYAGNITEHTNAEIYETIAGQEHIDISGRAFNANEEIYVSADEPISVTISGVEGAA